MGPVKDVMTANDDDRMDTGDGSAYVIMETRPRAGVDSAGAAGGPDGADHDAHHADSAQQVEEPGYGYGV